MIALLLVLGVLDEPMPPLMIGALVIAVAVVFIVGLIVLLAQARLWFLRHQDHRRLR